MNDLQALVVNIELHDVAGIQRCFKNGVDPNTLYNGEPLLYELTSEYTRTDRFSSCVKAFADYGLHFEDKVLLAVLLNDAVALEAALHNNPQAARQRYHLRCAYTPMYGVSLLHICAEFNHVACATVLINYGLDINDRAGVDVDGFGGQTPIFHTVNQNGNQSAEMLDFLLDNGANLQYTIPGLIWGKSYDWETLIPAVNPISYAMMGLLPQMHRNETTIATIVTRLLKHAYGIDYVPENVPCKYLQ